MNKIIIWIIVAVIVIGGIYYFWNTSSTSINQEPIKIGVSTILSGDLAAAGENIVNAARLTVDQLNEKGGVRGRPLELVIEDAQCNSKGGLNAATKLITVDKVKYIIGGTCSNGTLAAAPLANENKVLYLTPVTGGSNNDNAGEYVFRTANSDILAGRDIATAMIKLGYKNVAVIAEVTEYTIDIKKSFEKTISEQGGKVLMSEEFAPGTRDFRTIATKVKNANPEAILIASQTGIAGGTFIKQLKELSVSAPLFSDFTLVVNNDAKKIVGSFEGIYFADPAYDVNKQELKSFFAAYDKKFGLKPLVPFHAASTHDAIQTIFTAIEAVGDNSEKIHDWLITNVKNWNGFMGVYSLDKKGNSDLGFTIKRIENNQSVEVKF